VYVAPELPPPPYTSLTFSAAGGGGGVTVVKLHVLFAAIAFGGSFESWSVTDAPATVTSHVSPSAKSTIGSSV
jgi:hypothetical protein